MSRWSLFLVEPKICAKRASADRLYSKLRIGYRIGFLALLALSCIASCALREQGATVRELPEPTRSPDASAAEPHDQDSDLIDVADLAPYFDDVFEGEAAVALAEDRLEDAMRIFDDMAREVEDPILTPRARFLAAYLAQRLGDNARALRELPQLAHQLPLVADIAWETAAKSALALKKYDLAMELAGAIAPGATPASNSALIAADSLRHLERWEEAEQAYRRFLDGRPGKGRREEALSRLVACLARSGGPDGKINLKRADEGLKIIEELRAQSPGGHWTSLASRHEDLLLEAVGKEPVKIRKEKPAALKAYDRAARQMRKMRNPEAKASFAKVIRLARKNGKLYCRARLERAMVMTRMKTHGTAAQLFEETASVCDDPNIRVKALLKGGRAYVSSDRHSDAIRLFAVIEEEFAHHSYADDARLHSARSHLALGDRDTFKELILSIPTLYPSGDMRAEALWIASLDALAHDELESAKKFLSMYYELFPVESGWYTAGRSGYWMARVEELLGDTGRAADVYEQVIASAPLSYYMVVAHGRLSEIDPGRAKALMARLSPPGGKLNTTFSSDLLDENPGLATGVELLRLGLTTRARREIQRVLGSPDSSAEIHWVAAALFRRMGQFNAVREGTSGILGSWKRRYPSGNDLVNWTLAYPTAYDEQVTDAAQESGVEKSLLWAVMREESGFNPKVESWANAIGLMQIIMPTARSMARRLDIKINRKDLRDPATNIRLGAEYLAYLKNEFDGHPALVIAGYNAGEGAVARWLKARPNSDLDIFVEKIPFRQTRGYTKRVLSTLATYSFLYDPDRPVLTPELTLP